MIGKLKALQAPLARVRVMCIEGGTIAYQVPASANWQECTIRPSIDRGGF